MRNPDIKTVLNNDYFSPAQNAQNRNYTYCENPRDKTCSSLDYFARFLSIGFIQVSAWSCPDMLPKKNDKCTITDKIEVLGNLTYWQPFRQHLHRFQ